MRWPDINLHDIQPRPQAETLGFPTHLSSAASADAWLFAGWAATAAGAAAGAGAAAAAGAAEGAGAGSRGGSSCPSRAMLNLLTSSSSRSGLGSWNLCGVRESSRFFLAWRT